jgi:RHS repeat-associated protein
MPFGQDLGAGQFGRTTAQGYEPSGTPSNPREKFAACERDAETGLDFAQARYYQSRLGRFTTPDEFTGGPDEIFSFTDAASANPTLYADIADPQTFNKYQYCLNNPLRYVDSDGHQQDGQGGKKTLADHVRDAAQTVAETANGAASALNEDNGLPRSELPQNSVGRVLGHGIALFQSGLEILTGAGIAGVGGTEAVVAAPTVVGSAPGVAAVVGGTALAAHGGAVGINTLHNIFSSGNGSKTESQMTEDLSKEIGKNSVETYTPSEKIRVDLKGKAHFDKPTNTTIPTPHVQTAKVNRSPSGQINTSGKRTRPATKADVRTARRIVEHRKKIQNK